MTPWNLWRWEEVVPLWCCLFCRFNSLNTDVCSSLWQNSYHDLNHEAEALKRLEDAGAILYLHPHSWCKQRRSTFTVYFKINWSPSLTWLWFGWSQAPSSGIPDIIWTPECRRSSCEERFLPGTFCSAEMHKEWLNCYFNSIPSIYEVGQCFLLHRSSFYITLSLYF